MITKMRRSTSNQSLPHEDFVIRSDSIYMAITKLPKYRIKSY